MWTSSPCPVCGHSHTFILLGVNKENIGHLYVDPSPQVRYPIEEINSIDSFSPELHRAYISALNVYNSREWSATAVLCGKLLEGLTIFLVPESKHKLSLAKRLQFLPENQDFKKPILNLADEIRKGGNLGAHFDLEKEPDQITATQMIDLLEYLIKYLYILPKRIENLQSALDKLGAKKEEE